MFAPFPSRVWMGTVLIVLHAVADSMADSMCTALFLLTGFAEDMRLASLKSELPINNYDITVSLVSKTNLEPNPKHPQL